jgi:hypothetical protein
VWTRERVIEALQTWAEREGAWPRKTDWHSSGPGHPPCSIVRDVFGSWKSAVDAAQEASEIIYARPKVGGARSRTAPSAPRAAHGHWTRERIARAARAWRQRTGEWPKSSDWRRPGIDHPGYDIVRSRFAGWREMLDAAGAPTPKPRRRRTRRAIPQHVRAQVLTPDAVCSNPVCRAADDLLCDHIIPACEGGEDAPENLQPLCRSCNSRRQAMDWNAFCERELSMAGA